jgi:hypothetical protein
MNTRASEAFKTAKEIKVKKDKVSPRTGHEGPTGE